MAAERIFYNGLSIVKFLVGLQEELSLRRAKRGKQAKRGGILIKKMQEEQSR